ncbi:MAG: PspC domain-containing protein [Solirubrobacterales bacterium]
MEDERQGTGAEEDTEVREPETEPIEASTSSAEGQRPKRLLRSRDDRMIAGVAGGLGQYFGVDPIIIRIGFGVSVLFGGLGLVAYLALALFVPSEDGTDDPQAPFQSSKAMAVLAAGLVLLVLLSGLGGLLFWGDGPGGLLWVVIPLAAAIAAWAAIRDRGGWSGTGNVLGTVGLALLAGTSFVVLATGAALLTAVGEGVAVALGLIGAGVLLVALALTGGGRWLIVPVAAIGLGLSGAAASDLDLGGGIGERINQPVTVAEIPADGYELGIGRLVVDLRELDWRGQVIDLEVDLGIGEAVIAVPERVCVVAEAHVGAGEMRVVGKRSDGVDVDLPPMSASPSRPQLRLGADVDLGELRVVNDDAADLERGPNGLGRDFDATSADRNDAACAT